MSARKRKRKADNVIPLKTRRYEAASRNPRVAGWVANNTDANAAIGHNSTLRDRARDLVRNNPHAAKAVTLLTQSVVGYGIRASVKAKSANRVKVLQGIFDAWSHDPYQCDVTGRSDFYAIQKQAARAVFESGEVLIIRRPGNGQRVRFALQVLEADLIADQGQVEYLPNGGWTEGGIEYDQFGRSTAYRIWRTHPGSEIIGHRLEWDRFSASDVLHIYKADRPGQRRGVSVLAPVMIRLRELDIFTDAFLKRQQIANLFAAFITGAEDPAALKDSLEYELPELSPGTVWNVPEGQSITFSDPPEAAGYWEYVSACLRDVATGVPGITYEALTGDYSQSNFSASRMAAVVAAKAIEDWQYQIFIPQLCDGVWRWVTESLAISGFDVGDAYVEWTPPAITTISDPVAEYEALAKAVAGGFITWQEAVKSLGYDPQKQLDDIESFQKDTKGRNILLDFGIKSQPMQGSNGTNNANPSV